MTQIQSYSKTALVCSNNYDGEGPVNSLTTSFPYIALYLPGDAHGSKLSGHCAVLISFLLSLRVPITRIHCVIIMIAVSSVKKFFSNLIAAVIQYSNLIDINTRLLYCRVKQPYKVNPATKNDQCYFGDKKNVVDPHNGIYIHA